MYVCMYVTKATVDRCFALLGLISTVQPMMSFHVRRVYIAGK